MAFTEEELRLAEPEAAADSSLEAWYMDDSADDQRLPHRQKPNKPCSAAALRELGVLSWTINTETWEKDAQLAAIRKVRDYSYSEIVNISRDTLPNYDDKLKMFFEEHIHDDEEIRYIIAGSGFFDVRDVDDVWIRIHCKPGTMIVLPAGIYHRFTLDEGNYAKALRLFVGEPVWTPFNRPQDSHPARLAYLKQFKTQVADTTGESDVPADRAENGGSCKRLKAADTGVVAVGAEADDVAESDVRRKHACSEQETAA